MMRGVKQRLKHAACAGCYAEHLRLLPHVLTSRERSLHDTPHSFRMRGLNLGMLFSS